MPSYIHFLSLAMLFFALCAVWLLCKQAVESLDKDVDVERYKKRLSGDVQLRSAISDVYQDYRRVVEMLFQFLRRTSFAKQPNVEELVDTAEAALAHIEAAERHLLALKEAPQRTIGTDKVLRNVLGYGDKSDVYKRQSLWTLRQVSSAGLHVKKAMLLLDKGTPRAGE